LGAVFFHLYLLHFYIDKNRTGRPVKAKDFENAIVEELEKNNYHTRQQITDMILEKFGVTMSVSTVGRLLKKTVSRG
jgi:transposase